MASAASRPQSGSNPQPSASPAGSPRSSATDPILRNALRYTISAREYASLHRYVLSRSKAIKKRVPTVERVNRIMDGQGPAKSSRSEQEARKGDPARGSPTALIPGDDYNARAVRHSLRVFIATGALMKVWGIVSGRLMGSNTKADPNAPKTPRYKSPTLRLSLSLSTILLLYRLLFRFLTRLRAHLLDPTAAPFRKRNPRTALTLTSPYAPAVGASLAGLALGVYPAQQLRVSVAIYTIFRALEFGWNAAEDGGMIWGWEKGPNGQVVRKRSRPAWWGSWMLQPFAFGQLFHALIFDRDCFPMVSCVPATVPCAVDLHV